MAEVERVGDPDNLPSPVRTVVLVHAAQGLIDNGGLQYFFESDFPGQPPYSVFVEAYRAIGANGEADALADAVNLFPFADPHRSRERRENFLETFLDGGAHRPDSPFEPFTDRLITPARSVKVSPMAANSSGAAAANTPANPIRIASVVIAAP